MLAPLFLAIGLPLEGIGILIAVDAIPDLFATVTNATGDLAATTLVARFSSSTHALPVVTAIAAGPRGDVIRASENSPVL
jgi:Na+/H+-dicarboxylate symporter